MLIVETIGRIRREHLVKGKPIREIARYLRFRATRFGRCCDRGDVILVWREATRARSSGAGRRGRPTAATMPGPLHASG